MALTLAFDVYGTLINTHGLVEKLHTLIGEQASDFSATWRDKQLEYSFRRAVMGAYADFSVCTRDALEYTCRLYQVDIDHAQKQHLLAAYTQLPAFPDTREALQQLAQREHRLFAFSNGSEHSVRQLLLSADVLHCFHGVVSAAEVSTFKPNPTVYQHFLETTASNAETTWLISSNPFDIIGAEQAGFSTAWIQRDSRQVFDPWGIEPTAVFADLTELLTQLS